MPASEGHEGIILVADDNEANRELLSALLSAEGYEVVCVANGKEALVRMDGGSIDLALLDVVMPRPTGSKSVNDEVQAGNALDPRDITHEFEQRRRSHSRDHVRR
jgi:CheY-like chemotaxis protein